MKPLITRPRFHATSPEDESEREAENERQKQNLEIAMQAVMETEHGRWIMAHLIFETCGVLQPTFDPNPSISACKQGIREVGVGIQRHLLGSVPELYVQMLKERIAERGSV